MKISLRKANAVQAEINAAIKANAVSTSVNINQFQPLEEQLTSAQLQFWEKETTRSGLVYALYEIRSKVAKANSDAGINDMLTTLARLEKNSVHLTMLISKGEMTAMPILTGMIKQNSELRDEFVYNRRDVVTSIFSAKDIAQFKTDFAVTKRDKQLLQDKLLELNVHTTIDISEDTMAVLKDQSIL